MAGLGSAAPAWLADVAPSVARGRQMFSHGSDELTEDRRVLVNSAARKIERSVIVD